MPRADDYCILRSLPEIEAFFARIRPFTDARKITALIESGPSLRRIGSFASLEKIAGPEGAVEDVLAEAAHDGLRRGLPVAPLMLFPSGWVAVTGYLGGVDKGEEKTMAGTVRIAICRATAKDADPMRKALAQVLLGLQDCIGEKPGVPPLPAPSTAAWPDALKGLFVRAEVEKVYVALISARGTGAPPRLAMPRRDAIEPMIRWFSASHKPGSVAAQEARAGAARRAADPPAVDLALHVINMRFGELSDGGLLQSSPSDVEGIVKAARDWIGEAKTKRRLMVYAHGGLTPERDARDYAQATAWWWLENDVYPVFCVWESDAVTSILQLVREALGDGGRGPRDWSDIRDAAIERLVHALGQPAWDVMKRSAIRCSADGTQHGLTLFTELLKKTFVKALPPIDLVGHSAGSILHLAFIHRLVENGIIPETFQALAPAATNRLFREHLQGDDRAKIKTRIYAMQDAVERQDNVVRIYGKSLLYLVSRGFEDQFGEMISGLQKDLLADRGLVNLITRGWGGVTREAMVFSPTPEGTPERLQSGARSHGAFDNDPQTMRSVMAMIREGRDPSQISMFPEAAVEGQRSGGGGNLQFDLPEELRTYLSLARSGSVSIASAGNGGVGGDGAGAGATTAPAFLVPAAAHRGARLALTVGINEYAGASQLEGCVNDSDIWRDLLKARNFDVTQLSQSAQTGRDALIQKLRQFVARSGAGDSLIWHFSGHGMEFEAIHGSDDDVEVTGVDQAIVASNPSLNLTGQAAHAIIDDDLHTILQGLHPQASCHVFLDSCFSGSATRFSLPGRPRKIGTLQRVGYPARGRSLIAPMAAAPGGPYDGARHILFSAASATQVALENGTPPQGVFTRAVSDLLRSQPGALTNALASQRINELMPGNDQTSGLYCDPTQRDLPFPLTGS